MMPTVLSWLTTGIAVVGFLAAATVYLRGARDKGTIETLQRNNQALLERVDIQAAKIIELENSGNTCNEKIEAQIKTIEVLQNTTNSRELILQIAEDNKRLIAAVQENMARFATEIRHDIGEHHKDAMLLVNSLQTSLGNLPRDLANILTVRGPEK
jgi:cell division septum initiation protein DivIVA